MVVMDRACDTRGRSLSDSSTSVCCPKPPSHQAQPDGFRCSQCSQSFSTPAALRKHFNASHGEQDTDGPFLCSEDGCRFSTDDRQENQNHLMAAHGLNLVRCTGRSCKRCFLSQEEMESHRRSHMPFGCLHCQSASQNLKEFRTHMLTHKHLESTCTGIQIESPAEKQPGAAVEKNVSTASAASAAPSTAYLSEGSESLYRTHACPKCRRCFKMRSHLREHLRLHFPDPGLQCPTCGRFFTSRSKLRVHRLREAGEKLHRCPLCHYSAVERNAVRRHLASVHADEEEASVGSQSFLCPACGQRFHRSRALKAHMKTHVVLPDGAPLPCFQDGCSFQTCQRRELIRHAAEEHGVRAAECRHHACGAVFRCDADMEDHYRTHLAYHCAECNFSCSNKNVFLQHRRLGHSGEEELRCAFCPFVTFNPVEFEQHVARLHATEKIHRCHQCSYVTSHKRGLKRHLLMHSGEKPHKCSLCEFRCRDESYLSRHMLVHADDKNFMCAECGYVTKWKHYLTVHMRKHAGDLRYSCDQCSYRCHRLDQLKSHELRHQAKSLMCEICAYACKRKYELRNHMLAKHCAEEEEEEKSTAYKCKYCAYSTRYRQALQNHENCKHTKLKEFHCALCSYSSYSNVSLFLHKRKAHGYVPGDAAWLENYAAKEKERSSAEFVEDFYRKSSVAHELPGQPASGTQQNQPGSGPVCDSGHEAASFRSAGSPEQFCTLVLTTLTSTEEQSTALLNQGENHKSNAPDATQETLGPSTPTSSLDQDNADMQDGPCEQSDVEDAAEPPTSQAAESVDDRASRSEVRLKALRKHDKDQAEAMVLEGRVQMLAVPSEDVDGVSLHRGRMKGHECRSCGVTFKQRRGLDCHLKKKHPSLPEDTTTSISISNGLLTSVENPAAAVETRSDQMEPLSSANEMKGQQGEACSSPGRRTTVPEPPAREVQANMLPDDQIQMERSTKRPKLSQSRTFYVRKGGKFKCKLCRFSSAKLAAVKRHLLTCRETLAQIVPEKINEGKERAKIMTGPSEEPQLLGASSDNHENKGCMKPGDVQCPVCCFVAKSKRSLTRHTRSEHEEGALQDPAQKRLRRVEQSASSRKRRGALPHRCSYCPFSTSRRYRLEEHSSLHTGVGRHSCDVCSKTFGAAAKLRQHRTRVHDRRPTHFCPLCDFAGYAPDDVGRHRRRCHSGELRHACGHCDARFGSEVALRNHCKRAHRLQVSFTCQTCDFRCSSKVTLKHHQQSSHPEVKCTTCQEAFQTKESLDVHQRTHLAHPCQLCAFAARTRQLLGQHLLSEHEGGTSEDKPLRCSTCDFACRHQLVLEQHLREHGSKRMYKCTDCEYATRNKQKITWHIRIHTGERPYSCERCSYTCADPSRLKLHMRVHQEEKKYLCPECGYKCKWATQLKYHMTKHTGEKPYACGECEYRTNRADALRAHRDTQHCDVRPYVCEKCGKTFKTIFILKTHQKKHTDDRAYSCGLCQKSFRWPAGLRHHFLSHTEQRPFSCRHCSYRAKQRFQVVKHLQRHHPAESVEQGVLRDAKGGVLTLKEALQGALHTGAVSEQLPPTSEGEGGSEA
ncbi:zinc finger protein 142-like [Fundulus heteroclitus]|uniref:zinc finger protein 142-like n=1 Tax=Fundulus heteroclitus TaxID=8078 RepID=UPI00165BD7B5|nr:zinc finger protein 142-like [Fundulus heteroclitus]